MIRVRVRVRFRVRSYLEKLKFVKKEHHLCVSLPRSTEHLLVRVRVEFNVIVLRR